MAEDAAARIETRPRLGRGLAALLAGPNPQAPEAARARARRRSSSCARIHAIRASTSTMANLMNSPPRSMRAESSSQSWFGLSRASRTPMRSSPASAAGGPPSGQACTRSRSSSSRRGTARRSRSLSSRTCSAPISTRWRRRRATRSSAPITAIRTPTCPRRRQEPQPHRQHDPSHKPARTHAKPAGGRQDLGRARPRPPRRRRPECGR